MSKASRPDRAAPSAVEPASVAESAPKAGAAATTSAETTSEATKADVSATPTPTVETAPPPIAPESADAPATAAKGPETDPIPAVTPQPDPIVPASTSAAVSRPAAFTPAAFRVLASRHGAQAAAVALAIGVGFGLARAMPQRAAEQAQLVEATAGVRDTRQTLARLADDVQVLKTSLDGVKDGLDRPRDTARLTQALDRLDRGAKDTADKVARLGEQMERAERTQRDPARLAALTERLDRVEKQIAVAPSRPAAAPVAAAIPAAAAPAVAGPKPAIAVTGPDQVASTGSVGKPERVAGWVLRDAGPGVALVENGSGRFREVYAGQSLPGGVRILSVERRGRNWVVVTSKGLITPN